MGGPVGGAVDPMLGPLTDNGGSTFTHAPMVNSPVIDVGDPSVVPGTTTDQRGAERVFDGDAIPGARIDMGSVEFGSPLPPSGDFNEDGFWDCEDIDALVAEIVAGTNNPDFDMTTDGVVNIDDITDMMRGWLRAAGEINLGPGKNYLVGDANLDGFVDGLDFIIWNGNKFTMTPGWCSGDFNADGFVDGLDFIEWNANKFMSSDAVSNVPVRTARSGQVVESLDTGIDSDDTAQAAAELLFDGPSSDGSVETDNLNQASRLPFATVASHAISAARPIRLAVADFNVGTSAANRQVDAYWYEVASSSISHHETTQTEPNSVVDDVFATRFA